MTINKLANFIFILWAEKNNHTSKWSLVPCDKLFFHRFTKATLTWKIGC